MGFLDFVSSVGENLFGGGAESDQERSAKLENHVRKLELPVENLRIDVKEDVATVTGRVEAQATREKILLAVGNTEGIARVDDQLEVAKSEPEAKYYTVEKGDTLSKIAKEMYGDAMKYPVIFEANKPMLTNPDLIYPGQLLRIPPQDG